MAKTKTVFVTGASGFIAKHVVLQLLQDGYQVRGSVRSTAKADEVRAAISAHLKDTSDLDKRLTFVQLDLTKDAGWNKALKGTDALLHTASPFPLSEPKNEDDLIRPAVDGSLRALKAAKAAGVHRVVLTSSVASIAYNDTGPNGTVYDESDWTDVTSKKATAYVKSKTLAERAAWDFVKDNPEMELTTVNPSLVLGPALDDNIGSSLSIIQRFLNRADPALPKLAMGVVDVRDIATMHVTALSKPESIGSRFIGSAGTVWFKDVAEILKAAFPARKIITRIAPNLLVRLLGITDSAIRGIIPMLGHDLRLNNAAAKRVLGIDFISPDKSIKDAANFLIDRKLLK